MQFYSYDYVLSQISVYDWLSIASMIILVLIGGWFSIKYYKNNHDSKYREVVIIIILILAIIGMIKWTQLQTNEISDNSYRTSLQLIEDVSKQLKLDKSQVYINNFSSSDNAIIKAKGKFYRVIRSNTDDTYLLEKLNVISSKTKLIEVGK
ncbi:MAG: DUF3290 family protein [Streptococcus sp.]|nr:DUF3290 family protein [Streptococcus sp.]